MFNPCSITISSKITLLHLLLLLLWHAVSFLFLVGTSKVVGVQLTHNLIWIKHLNICLYLCVHAVDYGL